MNVIKKHPLLFEVFIVCLIILLSIPLILPYFNSGYFPTHDGEWAVVRLADMFRSLRDLQFPVRFSGALNFGYGYPLFNFAYPGPYYLGIPIYYLTGSFTAAIKIIFALSVSLSGVAMYFASRKLWNGILPGFISSIVYMYLPYRMVDLYVRGSIGESLSFVLFPIILFFGLFLFESNLPAGRQENKLLHVCLLSISIASLIITHNIMAVLFLPVFLSIIAAKFFIRKQKDFMKYFGMSFLLSVSLSAFFWMPAILEKWNIALSQIPIADRNIYFVSLQQIIIPSWGFNPPTTQGGFSYQLGISQLAVILIGLVLLVFNYIKKKPLNELLSPVFLLAIWIVLVVMMFSPTAIIWENISLLSEINYPWTLLAILGFISSLIAGYVVKQGKWISVISVVLIIVAAAPVFLYAKPSVYVDRSDQFYLTNEATTTSSNELMPLWVKKVPQQHYEEKVSIVKGNGKVENIFYNSKRISFNFISESPSIVRVSTIYYPGWKAYSGGLEKAIYFDNERGLMDVKLTSKDKNIILKFEETPLRMVSNLISIVSLGVLTYFILSSINFNRVKTKSK